MTDRRRHIPGVDRLLESEPFRDLLRANPRGRVLRAIRATLDRVRDELAGDPARDVPAPDELAEATRQMLAQEGRTSLRRVINATGIPLHTNLGRAPLAPEARDAVLEVTRGYSNLEYDLGRGARGSRHDHCVELIVQLTGAEAALVVNNNAAALLVTLNELCADREVIVSRGELVEIGGSFRVPEIVEKSGARVVEVGTTNRTHRADYERAVGPRTGALLKVHRSNFTQSGFVTEVEPETLAELGRANGLPLVHDLGSGLVAPAATLGLAPEPDAAAALGAGADVVTFSADKLLGGPQAGIIAGRAELIARIRGNPLVRAVRVGKLTLAALESTLRLWRDPEVAMARVPTIAMITAPPEVLRERAEALAAGLRAAAPAARVVLEEDVAEVGGGSCPGVELKSWVLRVSLPGGREAELARACRAADPPIVARVREGAVVLDPRTVAADEEDQLVAGVAAAIAGLEGGKNANEGDGRREGVE